jgi:pyruvate dehydrogenase E2 component (dihydrolipoamide acetyltransferase)
VAPPPSAGFSEREDVGSPVGTASFRAGSAAVLAPTNGTAGNAHGNGVDGHGGNASGAAGGRVFASPLARKIAEEAGVDLSRVEGSGPSGRITRKDVEAVMQGSGQGGVQGGTQAPGARAPQAVPAAPAPRAPQPQPMLSPSGSRLTTRVVPLSNMRRTIARRLVEAKQSIPHYQVTVEVEMDALMALRGQLNEQLAQQGVKLSVNDFIVRACALAMHQHPYVNARWAPGSQPGQENIEFIGEVNVGVAIALPVNPDGSGGGLVVATLRNADQVGLRQISAETKRLSEKARTKGLSIDEMSDSTFTISNLGMFGVSHFTAIINPPNVAILAVGAAHERPVVKNGALVPGHVMSMTMSSDHRVVDGAMAAQYLATVKGLLEKPATLLV